MSTGTRHHTTTHTGTHRNGHRRRTRHEEIADEAEGLLERLSLGNLTEEAKDLVGRLRENVAALRETAAAAQEQIQEGFHATEKQIKAHPWMAVGVTSAVGILIGYLLGRRGGSCARE